MQGADPVPLSALGARCHGDRPCETVSKPTCDEMHHGYRAWLGGGALGGRVLEVRKTKCGPGGAGWRLAGRHLYNIISSADGEQ